MARATRVQPDGTFAPTPSRGQFMGNRGCLHDAQGELGKARWRHKAWITCTLLPKPGRGPVPQALPGRYTPLFFMDEAVAAAAGHRPCAECRRRAFAGFRSAWAAAFGALPKAAEIDATLHAARLAPSRQQRRFDHAARDLPEGSFVLLAGRPHLLREDAALPYLPQGYGAPVALPSGQVTVLTPAPLVTLLRAGWQPVYDRRQDHPTWETP